MRMFLLSAALLACIPFLVACSQSPKARFTMSVTGGPAPLTARFANLSKNADAFKWDFGDGTTSAEREPSHVYTKAESQTVTLTAIKTGEPQYADTVTAILTVEPGALDHVELTLSADTLEVTEEHRFAASAFDRYGNEVSETSFTWTSESASGTIDTTGNFTASTSTGTYQNAVRIQARQGDRLREASASLTLEPGVPFQLSIQPESAQLDIGETIQFSVKVFDAHGNEITGLANSYSLSEGAGDSNVGPSGAFVAGTKAGTFQVGTGVQQRDVQQIAWANVSVRPDPLDKLVIESTEVEVGTTKKLTFDATDRYGNKISDLDASWRVDIEAGSVDPLGLFTASTRAGSFPKAIRVSVDDGHVSKEAVAALQLTAGPIDSVTISPARAEVPEGGSQPFSAKAVDRFGNELSGLSFDWRVTQGAGTIDAQGLFRAGTVAGQFREISATAYQDDRQVAGAASVDILDILPSGFGTATIDGVVNSKEWSAAPVNAFDTTSPNTAPVFALALRVMNDATNLYLGLTINDDEFSTAATWLPGGDSFRIDFDGDHNGVLYEYGENAFAASAGLPQFGDYFLSPGPGSPKSLMSDAEEGGTVDGHAVARRLEGLNHFEISLPLCSGDSWDFCLQAGDMIGLRLEYLDGEADGSFGGTAYVPAFRTDNWLDFAIAAPPARP